MKVKIKIFGAEKKGIVKTKIKIFGPENKRKKKKGGRSTGVKKNSTEYYPKTKG